MSKMNGDPYWIPPPPKPQIKEKIKKSTQERRQRRKKQAKYWEYATYLIIQIMGMVLPPLLKVTESWL